jgi:hypothetical protein
MTFRLASLVSLIFCVVCSASLPLTAVDSGLSVSEVAAAEGKQGWTSQPNERGTIDIITSCGITMFLCSWSVICLNVPGPDDSKFRLFRRKAYITALAFIGPEFLFQIALGQLVSARRSVKDFHASGYKQWTITHAFYADMGGFILHTKDWLPFPINAKQLHYLVIKGYVKLPELERETINDKNKVDILLRLITVFQILWFVINMAGRAAQELAITCGELTTAAFIVCSIGTTLCWIYKPADVLRPEIIETDVTISEILLKAGERAREPYSNTPLDFVSRKEWVWSIYWSNWINILLCGWNYSFPTYTELILWRAASVTIMATLVAYWAISEFGFSLYPAVQRRFANDALVPSQPKKTPQQKQQVGCHWLTLKVRSVASSIRNNSV